MLSKDTILHVEYRQWKTSGSWFRKFGKDEAIFHEVYLRISL